MSEQAQAAAAETGEPEVVELPTNPDAAFATLMDTLVKDEAEKEAGKGADPAAGTADAAGSAAGKGGGAGQKTAPDAADKPGAGSDAKRPAEGEGAGDPAAAGTGDATPTAGDTPGSGAGDAGPGGGDQQAAGPDTSAFGDLSNAFQDRTAKAYQSSALETVQTEHAAYFDALKQPPRALVGAEVPRIDGTEGMERIENTQDAKDWQEAVKSLLVQEVNSRAEVAMEENKDFITTVHASIDLFKNNPDLIPNTPAFDNDLAERFTTLMEPYELRVEGKLQGYSVPVQPLITQIRAQLSTEREQAAAAAPAATPAAAGSPAAGAEDSTPSAPAAAAQPAAGAPQGGIQSKAGQGEDKEDFSVLFGTIDPSLRDMQI